MERRDFLVRTGLAVGATALARAAEAARASVRASLDGWPAVRALFELDPKLIHMTGFFLASHPRPVREAIERHRRALDLEPVGYFFDNEERLEAAVLAAAADYIGGQPTDIALTDSTTMGLGLLYGGLQLRPGQEILTTTHDHYSTETSLRLRAERTGATVRQVPLYDRPASASEDEIVGRLVRAVRPETRVVALTWVHSVSGVKLPIRAIATRARAGATCSCASTASMASASRMCGCQSLAATSSSPAATNGSSVRAARGSCGDVQKRGPRHKPRSRRSTPRRI